METKTQKAIEPTMEQVERTIDDIVKDDFFISRIKHHLDILKRGRRNRPDPKPGYRYKMDWYDRMTDKGTCTATYFVNNIGAIWVGKSQLSSEPRQIIEFICREALRDTLKRDEENSLPLDKPNI